MPPSKRSCSPQADRKRYIVDALVEERAIELVKRPLLRYFVVNDMPDGITRFY